MTCLFLFGRLTWCACVCVCVDGNGDGNGDYDEANCEIQMIGRGRVTRWGVVWMGMDEGGGGGQER